MGMPNEYVHYAAAKSAIVSFTIGLSKEVIGDGIRVNSVSPGLIDTEMQMPERFARLAPTIPIGRAGSPEEVAEAGTVAALGQGLLRHRRRYLIAGGR